MSLSGSGSGSGSDFPDPTGSGSGFGSYISDPDLNIIVQILVKLSNKMIANSKINTVFKFYLLKELYFEIERKKNNFIEKFYNYKR